VHERVGRLREQSSRASRRFAVPVTAEAEGKASLPWERREQWNEWAKLSGGGYLRRRKVADGSGEDRWRASTPLTEAAAAFRIQKSDLALRPIGHQKEERVPAPLLVCFLGYGLWKTRGKRCPAAGLGDCPRPVFATRCPLRPVEGVLPTRQGVEIRRRCGERPDPPQAILRQRWGMRLPESLPLHEVSWK
jgi:hypothetical protein